MWAVWMLVGAVIGAPVGFITCAVMASVARDRRSIERYQRRARLGLPDRPPARLGAVGTARVRSAEFRPYRYLDSDST